MSVLVLQVFKYPLFLIDCLVTTVKQKQYLNKSSKGSKHNVQSSNKELNI